VLEYGVNFEFGFKKFRQIQFFLLFGIFDKPARAAILNMVLMTGYSSCLKCLQTGKTVTGELIKMSNLI
jgi:hypothetical protein